MSPDIRQILARIELMIPNLPEWDFVMKVKAEDAGMVMGAFCVVPILPAGVITEFSLVVSEAFEERLQVFFLESPVFGKGLIVVCERYERILPVEGSLVDAPDSPLF